jgi:serine/threonine-protein kinase
MAMERLEGEDLADVLRHRNQLPLRDVVELVRQVAAGLEAARKLGVVHRDIKPRNLFAAKTADGRTVWKILDFGVSKAAESSGTLTQNQIVGTPRYMAPEQAAGKPVDHRADQFALAIVAYRALTGRPAFMGESMPEILYQVLRTTPPAPSTIADVPPAVDAALAIAMAKDPDQRYATPLELADALARAASRTSARRQ